MANEIITLINCPADEVMYRTEIIDKINNRPKGGMHVNPGTTVAFAGVDTYEKIIGTWSDGISVKFTVDDVNDRLIYTGDDTLTFIMNGVSNLSVDRSCQTTYGLYVNGVLVPGAETPHTFAASARVDTISISGLIELKKNDYIEIWAKCDTAGTTMTIQLGQITMFA
jgi:hypothetical protein